MRASVRPAQVVGMRIASTSAERPVKFRRTMRRVGARGGVAEAQDAAGGSLAPRATSRPRERRHRVVTSISTATGPSHLLEAVADAIERLDHPEVVAQSPNFAQPLDVAVDGAVVVDVQT